MKEYIKDFPKHLRKIRRGNYKMLFSAIFLPYQYFIVLFGNWVIFSYFYFFKKFRKGEVRHRILQISPLTTIPYIISRILRQWGYESDFLAIGDPSKYWLKCGEKGYDLNLNSKNYSNLKRPFYELKIFWQCVSHYDIFHYHFLSHFFSTAPFCELKYLKKLGKKIVFHFSGCDIREKSITLTRTELNCCKECDYSNEECENPFKTKKRKLAKKYGNLFLVTTPDLLQYIPEGHHLPFTRDLVDYNQISSFPKKDGIIRIVHATNHDGIEGTRYIEEAVAKLKSEGYPVELLIVRKIPHEKALQIYKSADICVGKLTMGFYANFQLESMSLGKPTLCYIREDLKKFVSDCPILNTTPKNVYENIKMLCENQNLREDMGRKGIEFVNRVHNNLEIGKKLLNYYGIMK